MKPRHDIKPEHKSDEFDRTFQNYVKKDSKRRLWINITLVFVVVLVLGQYLASARTDKKIETLAEENHKVLVIQIPGLQNRIAEQEKTIRDQSSVITQAVDWILKLSDQIRELGGTPPEIILKPEE